MSYPVLLRGIIWALLTLVSIHTQVYQNSFKSQKMPSAHRSNVVTPEEKEASLSHQELSVLMVAAWCCRSCHASSRWLLLLGRVGEEQPLLPEQLESSVSQLIPSTCSAMVWPLKQTSSCKTIQLQVIKRINLVMLQSEREHVIHYSSITGLIHTRLIRVHHCLKLSTKKMF